MNINVTYIPVIYALDDDFGMELWCQHASTSMEQSTNLYMTLSGPSEYVVEVEVCDECNKVNIDGVWHDEN